MKKKKDVIDISAEDLMKELGNLDEATLSMAVDTLVKKLMNEKIEPFDFLKGEVISNKEDN